MGVSRLKGATMAKMFGVVLAAVLLSTNNGGGIMMSDEPSVPDGFFDENARILPLLHVVK